MNVPDVGMLSIPLFCRPHGRNPKDLHTNDTNTFIIRNKIFGTFQPEAEISDYGLVQNLGTFNPLRVALQEWVGMLRYIFTPNVTLKQRCAYAP